MMDVGSIIGAGIQANASVTGDVMQYLGAQEQRRSQEQLYDRQLSYQTAMANSAHQREVEDLRKAGLNPMLSGTGGSGAASPAAPNYQPQNLMGGLRFSAADAVRTFLDSRKTLSEIGINESVKKINDIEAVKKLIESKISSADLSKMTLELEELRRQMEVIRTMEGKPGEPVTFMQALTRGWKYLFPRGAINSIPLMNR